MQLLEYDSTLHLQCFWCTHQLISAPQLTYEFKADSCKIITRVVMGWVKLKTCPELGGFLRKHQAKVQIVLYKRWWRLNSHSMSGCTPCKNLDHQFALLFILSFECLYLILYSLACFSFLGRIYVTDGLSERDLQLA